MVTNQLPGRTITSKGREYLYFSGTSYLGLSHLDDFKELIKEGLDRVGVHFGGSRLSNIQIDVFDEAEAILAEKCGAEAALIVSSGTLAGQVTSFLAPQNSRVYVAPGTHAAFSIHFGQPPEMSRTDWEREIQKHINSSTKKAVVVTNSVDPLFCQPIDIDWIGSLNNGKNTTLIVDDSHGIGVMGLRGEGLYSNWSSYSPGKVVFAGSLGKSMGIPAGFVLADREDILQLKSTRTYGGSSPANPAFLYAFIRAEKIHERQLSKLRININRFLERLEKPRKFSFLRDYPVFYTADPQLGSFLLDNGMVISDFHYPGSDDPLITRVVINALHTEEDIDNLSGKINEYFREN